MKVVWTGPSVSVLGILRGAGETYELEDAVGQEMVERGFAVPFVEPVADKPSKKKTPVDVTEGEE